MTDMSDVAHTNDGPEISDDLVAAALNAQLCHHDDFDCPAPLHIVATPPEMRRILAAVLPLHEKQLRQEIADDVRSYGRSTAYDAIITGGQP